jgi:DNA-binding PadR family transcriptional regulator
MTLATQAMTLVGFTVLSLFGIGFYVKNRFRVTREAILELLEDGPSYGLDLVKRSDGRLRRGSVYAHLHRLEEAGEIRSWEVEATDPAALEVPGQLPRRMYALNEVTNA